MTKKQQVHRLEDLLVEEVSIVDRPANKRPFLMVKSEGGHGAEVVPGSGGELVTDPAKPAPAPPAPTPTPAMDPAIADRVEKMLTRIEKGLTLTPEVRRELFNSLGEGMRRVHVVMNLADAAQTEYDGKEPSALAPLFATELAAAAASIAEVGKKIGKLAKNDPSPDPDPSDVEKGLSSLVEGLETEIQKRGAKMSSARLGKFKEALGLLHKLLEELDNAAGNVKPEKGRSPKQAAETPPAPAVPVEVTKALETATAVIETLKATVKKQAQEIRTLKEARPASQAIPVDTSEPAPRAPEKVTWPRDMNA